MERIGERIKQLRESANITQEELAKDLNVGRETVARWENGTRDIKTEATISLAKYFNVTTDYLLCISDYKTHEAADIGTVTGLYEDNIKWLQEYIKHTTPENEEENETNLKELYVNGFLSFLRTNNFIERIIRLRARIIMATNEYEKISNSNYSESNTLIVLYYAIKEEFNRLNAEILTIVDILTGYNEIKKLFDDFTEKWLNDNQTIRHQEDIFKEIAKHYDLKMGDNNGND